MSTTGLERNSLLGRLAFASSENAQCKFLPQPSSASPLASNPHLITAFTRQYEVLQSLPWLGNLLSKVTGLFISGRETSVPGLCQLKHEQDQRESAEAGEQ